MSAADPHWLYRVYDAAGALLYIGCTENMSRRFHCHLAYDNTTAAAVELRERMSDFDVEGPFPDRVSGRAAERAAIAREAPLLNRQHNPARWRWVKATNSWQPAVYAAA